MICRIGFCARAGCAFCSTAEVKKQGETNFTMVDTTHLAPNSTHAASSVQSLDAHQKKQQQEMMLDEDPLLISQTLTYVTDDGSVLHSFQSSPFSFGREANVCRVVWIFNSLWLPHLSFRSSWRIQTQICPPRDHVCGTSGRSSSNRSAWNSRGSVSCQSVSVGLVLVQFGAICWCDGWWGIALLDWKHWGGRSFWQNRIDSSCRPYLTVRQLHGVSVSL